MNWPSHTTARTTASTAAVMMAVSAQTSVRLVENGRPPLGTGRMVFHEPREDDPSEPPSSVLFPMTKRADTRGA